jgi:hypothetical protein
LDILTVMTGAGPPSIRLILSFQRALLGAVTDNLYAVAASISDDERRLRVVGYYLGDPYAKDEWEALSVAITEVCADYADLLIEEDRYVDVRVEPLPDARLGDLIFLRHVRGM